MRSCDSDDTEEHVSGNRGIIFWKLIQQNFQKQNMILYHIVKHEILNHLINLMTMNYLLNQMNVIRIGQIGNKKCN